MAKTKTNRTAGEAKVTQIEFEKALTNYKENSNSLTSITSERDAKIAAIMKEYEGQVANLENVKVQQFNTIKNFCLQNKDTLFSEKKRSITNHIATFGLRKDTPSVVTDGKNWEAITKLVKQKLPAFIRTVEEVNKAEILAKRAEIGLLIKECGMKIKQEDKFFITLLEETPVPTVTLAENKEVLEEA